VKGSNKTINNLKIITDSLSLLFITTQHFRQKQAEYSSWEKDVSRLLSRSHPLALPLLCWRTSPVPRALYPGHHPKSTRPGGRVKAGWRRRAGPTGLFGKRVAGISTPPSCWSCCLRWAQPDRGDRGCYPASLGSLEVLPAWEAPGKAFSIRSLGEHWWQQ